PSTNRADDTPWRGGALRSMVKQLGKTRSGAACSPASRCPRPTDAYARVREGKAPQAWRIGDRQLHGIGANPLGAIEDLATAGHRWGRRESLGNLEAGASVEAPALLKHRARVGAPAL